MFVNNHKITWIPVSSVGVDDGGLASSKWFEFRCVKQQKGSSSGFYWNMWIQVSFTNNVNSIPSDQLESDALTCNLDGGIYRGLIGLLGYTV